MSLKTALDRWASRQLAALQAEAAPEPEPAVTGEPPDLRGMARQTEDVSQRLANLEQRDARWAEIAASGYTEEGARALVEFMQKNGIADPVAAAPAFERTQPVAEMAVPGGRFDGMPAANAQGISQGAVAALLNGDDEAFMREAIPAAIAEARGGYR
jgi:hypothetical protein